jgi:nitrite reductase/ring-hydroxylating ferredoxin subunit/uncharacterized membrane protein
VPTGLLSNLTSRLAGAIEQADVLDAVADRVQGALSKLPIKGPVRSALSGTWLGHPAHPFLVATPIGCWTSASVLDLLGQRRAAQTLVGAGVLSVVPTAMTGISDWMDTDGAERRVGLVHWSSNVAATWCYGLSWNARRKGRHARGIVWSIAGAGIASGAGWLGGHLAYAMGVGVDTNAFDGGALEWTALDIDPPAGPDPVRAVAKGTPLVVSRQPEGLRALADRCSHRGGPLSEGTVEGGCVTCPWHGSRFDLATGAVVEGPASVAQPSYEVRERDGLVEVRRVEERSLRNNTVRA